MMNLREHRPGWDDQRVRGADIPVCRFRRLSSRLFPDSGLESPENRQAGKPAPRSGLRPIVNAGFVSRVGATLALTLLAVAAQEFDLVINYGRVMDPESGLDAVRHVGIRGGKVVALSERVLTGTEVIDARGLVVAPGFIDLHQHAWDEDSIRFKVQDGVTSALELEVGAADVDAWYREREGKTPFHFGVSIGHVKSRMAVMGDRPTFLPTAESGAAKKPASEKELAALKFRIEHGLKRGAVAVGFGLAYTPSAGAWEIIELFRVAARYGAPCHVHMRYTGSIEPGSLQAFEELVTAALVTGAPLHVVHLQATGKRETFRILQMMSEARKRGVDITAEVYPYTAGMTDIRAAIFDKGWREKFGLDYGDMQWSATGERLTAETFAKYRKTGGMVIVHTNPERIVTGALVHPFTMVASDGLKGHPRNAGTFARVLGFYVREQKVLSLMDGLRKITLMPARQIERRVPSMKNKGRIKIGCDADLVVFDPQTIRDRATYTEAFQASEGITHVLVDGQTVVRKGDFQEKMFPGKAIRAAIVTD